MGMDKSLLRRFQYHPPPNARVGENHSRMREACIALLHEVCRRVPEGREQSLAITKLEEVMMWSNAGIAREGFEGPEALG